MIALSWTADHQSKLGCETVFHTCKVDCSAFPNLLVPILM